MALVLCLSLLPATALAADGATVNVGSVALTGSTDNPAYATTDATTGKVTLGGDENTYNIKWDGETLTLRNATILEAKEYDEKNKEKIAIYLASGNMTLALVGKNTVDALGGGNAASCGINLGSGSLTISGENSASLTVYGGPTEHGNSCGIYANGTITIDSGTVTVTGESASAASYGICARGAVTIEDGTVTATSGEAGGDSIGIYTSNSVTINGGDVTATGGNAVRDSYGIYASSFTINGGTVVATGGEAAVRYSMGVRADGDITINDGVVTATGDTAPDFSYGMSTNGNFTMNGGIVTATSGEAQLTYGIRGGTLTIKSGTLDATSGKTVQDSVGIFAVGDIKIDGGTVTAKGGETIGDGWYNFGIRSYGGSIIIEGGTVTATGGTAHGTVNNMSSGLFARAGSITVSGGTVTATGGESTGNGSNYSAYSTGFFAKDAVTVSGGTVTATGGTVTGTAGAGGSYGIYVENKDTSTVTINGDSVVRLNTTGDNAETISGTTVKKESGIVFENGVGTVYGNVTLREDLTIASGETLTIPEGTTLTNNGRIQNHGALQVKGKITGNAVTGSGTIQGSGQWPGKPEPVPIPPTYAVTTPETTGGTVTVSPSRASSGRTVTITAAPDTGFALESLTVLDSRGNEIALTDKGGGKYTFTMPASRVTVEASFAPAPLPFEDVAPGAWYESAVRYAYFHNIMEGMRETEFAPATALTRAMAAQILYNLEGQPDLSSENLGYPYEDVDAQAWYGDAVYWARITGVATGYGDGTFQPGDSITRQEFAQMLYNYAKYKGYDLTAEGDLSTFPDANSIADWAEAGMSWANGNQLINGHDDGTIDAAGIGTRAQAASILMKFDQNLAAN